MEAWRASLAHSSLFGQRSPCSGRGVPSSCCQESRPQPAWHLATCGCRSSPRLRPRPAPRGIPSCPGLQVHTCDLGHHDADARGRALPSYLFPWLMCVNRVLCREVQMQLVAREPCPALGGHLRFDSPHQPGPCSLAMPLGDPGLLALATALLDSPGEVKEMMSRLAGKSLKASLAFRKQA